MSAEKEIVNYWYNKRGFFTINNLKANNKDCGILALKFENNEADVFHVEVSCSITNNVTESANLSKSIARIIDEKFMEKGILDAVKGHISKFSIQKDAKKVIVLGSISKSRKGEIIREFAQQDVEVVEFENILLDVLQNLDTQYYRNDIIRTLQLAKFLLLSEPTKLAKLLSNDAFSSSSRKEFLSTILENEEIIKEFRKTNSERLGMILKNSTLKPNEIAKMLENDILNKRTRKVFLDSLMEQESTRKIMNKQKKARKMHEPLAKFFG